MIRGLIHQDSFQLCSEDFIPTLEGKVGLNVSPFVAPVRE